jgi:hypothetical protein
MAENPLGGDRPPGLLTSALIVAACCALVWVAIWAPIARAQLILSTLPGMAAIAAIWMSPRRPK